MKSLHFLFFMIFVLGSTSCQKSDVQVIPEDDYWDLANPAQHNFDLVRLNEALSSAETLNRFYALLIVRNQKLVVEEYYEGRTANDLFHLRSITKNITSALSGIAIEEGLIDSAGSLIRPFFPNLITGDKEAITFRDLLNMASGLEWEEDTEVLDAIEHRIADPVSNLLSRQLSDFPSTTFNYNSLSPHVVAHVIEQQSGRSLRAYAREKLFDPLGVDRIEWQRGPQGAEWGGFGLQLTARDLAKFGQLYLNEGKWEDQQVVPLDWARQSFQKQIQALGPNTGYSYQWWISTALDMPIYYGRGYGGQALLLIPEKNLMVVALQEYLVSLDQSQRQWEEFIGKVFVPIYEAAQ